MSVEAAYAGEENGVLVIGSSLIERRVKARVGASCRTVALLNKLTKRNYQRAPARELAFSVDGRPYGADDLRVVDVQGDSATDPVTATVRLRAIGMPLELDLRYAIHRAHSVVRKDLVFTNRGDALLTISNLDWADLELLIDTHASAAVWVDHFTRRAKSTAVSMERAAVLVVRRT